MNMVINIEGSESIINKVVALLRAIPEVKIQTKKSELIPNAETLKALEEVKTGIGCKTFKNSSEMFKSLGINV